MKKILLLTGICILSACGGGSSTPISGGATAGTPAEGRPNLNDHLISKDARESNYVLTSILSQIFIPKDNEDNVLTSPSGGTRAATDVKISGKDYTAYDLENVKFYMADKLPSDEMYVTFGINESGAIDSLYMHGGDKEMFSERINKTNQFNMFMYKYQISDWQSDVFLSEIKDRKQLRTELEKQMKADGLSAKEQAELLSHFDNQRGMWLTSEINSEIRLFGYDVGTNGLRYADFGYNIKTVDNDIASRDHVIIAGGYDVLNIPVTQIGNQKLQFKGKAVANISYKDTYNWQSRPISTGNNATVLVLDNGKETLTMPFNDYYTVIVEKEGDKSNIKFTDWKGTDSNFKFENETATSDDAWILYYGTNNKPTEAVGTVEHSENTGYRPSFEAGFGVQVTQ